MHFAFFLLFSSLFSARRRQWADRCARLSGLLLHGRACSPREGPACPGSASLSPGVRPGVPTAAGRTSPPPATHTFWPLNTQEGEQGFPGVRRQQRAPSSLRRGWLPGAFGQGAWLVVGQERAHSAGLASSPPSLPARDVEAAEEKLEDGLRPSVTCEEESHRGRAGREGPGLQHPTPLLPRHSAARGKC